MNFLAKRMKRYESVNQTLLPLNSYVIVRVDGRAFGTYTKGLKKPFDQQLINAMDSATLKLCKEMQNAVLGYVQSDEISILMYDGEKPESEPWFGNEVEKIVSVSASIATNAFNKRRILQAGENLGAASINDCVDAMLDALNHLAEFDSRVFVLPNVDEVCNYFLWRYNDWTRNSKQAAGQTYFSTKQLHGKSTNEIQEMLFQEKGINWNNYSDREKRGGLVYKNESGWLTGAMPHVVCTPDNEFYKLIPQ